MKRARTSGVGPHTSDPGRQTSATTDLALIYEVSVLTSEVGGPTPVLPAVSLLFPRITVHVVAVLFPEAWGVVVEEFQAA